MILQEALETWHRTIPAMAPERLHRHDQQLDSNLDDSELAPAEQAGPGPRAGVAESDAQLDGVVQRSEDEALAAPPEGGELGNIADQIAAERGKGRPLDPEICEAVERSLGYDLKLVRVHDGPSARQLARDVGAIAFTAGRDIFIGEGGSASDLSLMTHELTHTIQQGFSEAKPKTLGATDTAHEQAAEAGAASPGSASEVQRFTDDKQVKGQYARVSENGHVVVLGESNFSQDLYASAQMIDHANGKLAASGEQGSYLRLVRTGDVLKHAGSNLEKVAPVFTPQGDGKNAKLEEENKGKDQDDKMGLYADCGRSSRVVMGSHGDQAPHGTYKSGGKEKDTADSYRPSDYSDQIYVECLPQFLANGANAKYLKEGVHYTGSKDNVVKAQSADQAREQYWELGDAGRRAFDQMAGINTGANPEIGGGYTLNTEYDMPGFKEKGDMTWNFHWAGCVMKDGTDNITLENYAAGTYDTINTEWNFQMYGTVKKGQTFLEEHLASNTHGTRGSAFAVEPEGS